MATALTPLANITLGSAAASVTFSSIVGTYRDLFVVGVFTPSASAALFVQYNNDTASNYSTVEMAGTGSSALSASYTTTSLYLPLNNNFYNTSLVNFQHNVMDYSATDKHKAGLTRLNYADGQVNAEATRWASTSAITTLKLSLSSGNFATGSSFALYGVSA